MEILPEDAPTLAGEPTRTVRLGEATVTLLGTAHVSAASTRAVEELVRSGQFDAVAVELCESRYRSMIRPETLEQLDLFKVLREGKAGMVAASLALGAYQQRLGSQFGINPGAEMQAAITGARERHLPLLLVDREIGVTLRRVYRAVPWWQRMTLISGLLASILSRDSISEEELEHLKDGDILESAFAEFAERSPPLYATLIAERDRFMAARLRQEVRRRPRAHILAVVGAGHLAGTAKALESPPGEAAAEVAELSRQPRRSVWLRGLPWAVVALILGGFALGFSRNTELGWDLVIEWVLINGGLAAVGAALAAAHPLTVIGAFAAAPLTSLNPTIGAGFVTAAIEMALRRPRVADFRTLRDDATRWQGWWRNRVSRTLLVFLFSTLGSALGTYLAGFRIAERLL